MLLQVPSHGTNLGALILGTVCSEQENYLGAKPFCQSRSITGDCTEQENYLGTEPWYQSRSITGDCTEQENYLGTEPWYQSGNINTGEWGLY